MAEQRSDMPKIVGSTPTGCTAVWERALVAQRKSRRFRSARLRVRAPPSVLARMARAEHALVAQRMERAVSTGRDVGSSPTEGAVVTEPDGEADVCKTSRSGFNSHRHFRLTRQGKWSGDVAQGESKRFAPVRWGFESSHLHCVHSSAGQSA